MMTFNLATHVNILCAPYTVQNDFSVQETTECTHTGIPLHGDSRLRDIGEPGGESATAMHESVHVNKHSVNKTPFI